MNVFGKFLDAIKINDDDDDMLFDEDIMDYEDEDEGDFLDEEDEIDEPKPKSRFLEKFGRRKPVEEEILEDDYEEAPEEPKPSRTFFKSAPKPSVKPEKAAKPEKSVKPERAARTEKPEKSEKLEKPVRATSSKITPMRSSRRNSQAVSVEVCVIKPLSMEEAREIADTLLDNSTVILNLEGIDVELAQRIIDFASGACYSVNGSLQKISNYIFVLGPSSVDITGDLQNILGGGSAPSVRAGY